MIPVGVDEPLVVGLKHKWKRALVEGYQIVERLDTVPAPNAVAAVHPVFFGDYRSDPLSLVGAHGLEQINSTANGPGQRQHPLHEQHGLGGFRSVQGLGQRRRQAPNASLEKIDQKGRLQYARRDITDENIPWPQPVVML